MFPKDITKWNSNDLMDKIESPEPEDSQGNQLGAAGPGEGGQADQAPPPQEGAPRYPGGLGGPAGHGHTLCLVLSAHGTHRFCVADGLYRQSTPEFRVASSVEQLNIIEVSAEVAEGQGRGQQGPGRQGPVPGGQWRQSLAPTASCPRWPGHHWREAWDPPPLKFLTTSRVCSSRTTPPQGRPCPCSDPGE